MDQLIKPRSLGGYVRALSGLFITKENPLGLTNMECSILAAILTTIGDREITREDKIDLANLSQQKLQVITNYLNKLKRKKAITANNRINPILSSKSITIEYGTTDM